MIKCEAGSSLKNKKIEKDGHRESVIDRKKQRQKKRGEGKRERVDRKTEKAPYLIENIVN